jgi:hypothetical protein
MNKLSEHWQVVPDVLPRDYGCLIDTTIFTPSNPNKYIFGYLLLSCHAVLGHATIHSPQFLLEIDSLYLVVLVSLGLLLSHNCYINEYT